MVTRSIFLTAIFLPMVVSFAAYILILTDTGNSKIPNAHELPHEIGNHLCKRNNQEIPKWISQIKLIDYSEKCLSCNK